MWSSGAYSGCSLFHSFSTRLINTAQDRRLQRLGSLLEQLHEHCAFVGEGSRQAMAAVHHSLRAFW